MLLRAMAGAALYASPIFIATLFTEPEPLPPFSAAALPSPSCCSSASSLPRPSRWSMPQKTQGKGRIRAGARQAQPRHHPHQVPELGVPHRPRIPLRPDRGPLGNRPCIRRHRHGIRSCRAHIPRGGLLPTDHPGRLHPGDAPSGSPQHGNRREARVASIAGVCAEDRPHAPAATSDNKKGLFGGFCGRDSGIGPAQRAKTTIWN